MPAAGKDRILPYEYRLRESSGEGHSDAAKALVERLTRESLPVGSTRFFVKMENAVNRPNEGMMTFSPRRVATDDGQCWGILRRRRYLADSPDYPS